MHFASLHRPPDAAHWMAEVSPIACQRRLDVFCFVCVRGHKTPRSSSLNRKAPPPPLWTVLLFVHEFLEFVTFLSETIINVEIFQKG